MEENVINKGKQMRKYLLSLVAAVLLIPTLGLAADVRTAEVINKEETPKNLYLAGQNPTVDANITGDLVIAGGTVTVNGNVQNSVLAAGADVRLVGTVGQSVRVAAGTVNVESVIGGDLVVFGGDVILGTKSVVAGDLLVFGGTVTMKGTVLGSVKRGYSGAVIISGKVGGDVNLNDIGTLQIDSAANIQGKLKYSSQAEAAISSEAKVVGGVEYTKISAQSMQPQKFSDRLGSIIIGAVMALISLLIFIKLLPKFSAKVIADVMVDPWKKAGVGFLAIVVTPIILFILLLTFFGWGVMGYLGLAYMTLFAVTGTLSALFVGSYVWKLATKGKDLEINWKIATIGVVILAIIKSIPYVGWIAGALLVLLVFGTLTLMSFSYLKAQKA